MNQATTVLTHSLTHDPVYTTVHFFLSFPLHSSSSTFCIRYEKCNPTLTLFSRLLVVAKCVCTLSVRERVVVVVVVLVVVANILTFARVLLPPPPPPVFSFIRSCAYIRPCVRVCVCVCIKEICCSRSSVTVACRIHVHTVQYTLYGDTGYSAQRGNDSSGNRRRSARVM